MITFLYKHPVTSCCLNISSCEIDKAVKWDGTGSGGRARAGCGSTFVLGEWSNENDLSNECDLGETERNKCTGGHSGGKKLCEY